MRFWFTLLIFNILALASCSSTPKAKFTDNELKGLPILTVTDLTTRASDYFNKRVIVDGCLDYIGIPDNPNPTYQNFSLYKLPSEHDIPLHQYEDGKLLQLEEGVVSRAVPIYLEHYTIPKKYRKNDIDINIEEKPGVTNSTTDEGYDWRVLVTGIYKDEPTSLSTRSFVLVGLYETRLTDVTILHEFYQGCNKGDP